VYAKAIEIVNHSYDHSTLRFLFPRRDNNKINVLKLLKSCNKIVSWLPKRWIIFKYTIL